MGIFDSFKRSLKGYVPLKNAFTPFKAGGIEAKNRFFRSATWLGLAAENGEVTQELTKRYSDLVRGDVGFIWTGLVSVSPEGVNLPRMLQLHSKQHIDSLGRLARSITRAGGKIGIQLAHGGAMSKREFNGRKPVLAPSEIRDPRTNEIKANEISIPEIMRIISDFTHAAGAAKAMGFNAIQLHLAHGFLFNQFLSPRFNKRSDQYGGQRDGRAFIIKQTLEYIRNAIGNDFPIWVKMNCSDFVANGQTEDDALSLASHLMGWGVNGIEVSGGTPDSGKLGPCREVFKTIDEAYFLSLALKIKKVSRLPVILVGGIRSTGIIEDVLIKGIDGISLSRPLICEPLLVKRFSEGDLSPSICLSCNECFRYSYESGAACAQFVEE
ncbi:MAG: NADH:flavin oxidoreductase [Candidatus Coatesbacteria bacterium]|nr:NADH:flavin oxidoreductase [Candidatus Coatesbacteria bacterium]